MPLGDHFVGNRMAIIAEALNRRDVRRGLALFSFEDLERHHLRPDHRKARRYEHRAQEVEHHREVVLGLGGVDDVVQHKAAPVELLHDDTRGSCEVILNSRRPSEGTEEGLVDVVDHEERRHHQPAVVEFAGHHPHPFGQRRHGALPLGLGKGVEPVAAGEDRPVAVVPHVGQCRKVPANRFHDSPCCGSDPVVDQTVSSDAVGATTEGSCGT